MNRLAWLALLAFAFVLPWEDSLLVPGVGSLGRISGLLLLICALPSLLTGPRIRLRQPSLFLLVMTLFVIWSAVSWLWRADPGSTATPAISRLQLLALGPLVWPLIDRPARAQPAPLPRGTAGYVAPA